EMRVGQVELDPHHTVIAFHVPTRIRDVHGTFMLREGRFVVDPRTGAADGMVVVDATSGESGNAARDSRMAGMVLDAARVPDMRFRVDGAAGTQEHDGAFHGTLHGLLVLHGDEHPLEVAVDGRVADDVLAAHGRFSVPYVAWGLRDPSLFILTVAPAVDIDVT